MRGVGTLLALPLLEAMVPMSALAQSGKAAVAPQRLAFLFVPNGINMAEWTPKTDGALALSKTLEPLAPVKDYINVLTGLTQDGAFAHGDGGGDHARSAAAWLTGTHPVKTSGANIKAGISADQVAAHFIGKQSPFPSLELGCERGGLAGDCDSGYSCAYSNTISWRTESTPMAKETDPRLVFERLFTAGSDEEETEAARKFRLATDKSILDFVMDDASSLRKQLGNHDRRKLDEYFEGVREVERRLQWVEKMNADRAAGNATLVEPTGIPALYNEHIRLMGDMMVLAFQADLTRITTFMFANEGSNRAYREINVPDGHHDMSHHGMNPEKLAKVQKINQFHVEQLAYILDKMRNIKEGNGSMLDNTLLVYGGGISDGDRHNHDDLPLLLAGGAAMGVKGGRHINYKDYTPMTNLLLTLFDKVGIPTDQVQTLGDSTGRLQVV